MIIRGQLRSVTLMVVGAWLAGCASTSPISRIDANRALYESWPLDTQQAVLDGKVEMGMTPAMVEMTLGKPAQVVSRSAGSVEDEIWIYRKGGDSGGMMDMGGPNISMGGSMGGLSVGNSGMGTNMGTGMGMGTNPSMSMPVRTPVEEREIVFENGVVIRADPAL